MLMSFRSVYQGSQHPFLFELPPLSSPSVDFIACFNDYLVLYTEKAMAPHSSTLAWKIPWMVPVHGVAKSRARLSDFTFTFHFHALEKEMAIHSSSLAWRIPGTEEPSGLPSMGLHRVGHD